MQILSHFSSKASPSLLLPSLTSAVPFRRPNFPFYPSSSFKFPSLACHLSSLHNNRPPAPMDSPPPEQPSVDSVTHDLRHQSLAAAEAAPPRAKLKLEDLNWDNSFVRELPGDPRTDTFPREGLPNLEELKCDTVFKIKYVFGCEALVETEQSKLRKIELSRLNRLRSIREGPAPPAMFQNLQSLSIQQCTLQGSLFTADVAQNLGQLRFLDLYHCRFLERIVEASNKKIDFQKLKDLRLTNLPRLDYESTTIDFECPSLEDFYLWDCPKFLVSVSDFHSYNQVQLYDDFTFYWDREMEMSDHESEEEDLSDQESEEQDSEYESEEQDLSDQESEEQDSDKPDESGEGEVSVCCW